MHTFSILVSIRDTDDEYDYMKKSFPSALELNPTEIIVGLDKPASKRIIERVKKISKKYNFNNLKFLEIEKSKEWGFQLAHIEWKPSKINHDLSKPTGAHSRIVSNNRAEDLLGFKKQDWTTIKTGIKKTMAWYTATHSPQKVANEIEILLKER